jgi:hypothetical protein
MSQTDPEVFSILYQSFQAPITALDCGKKCAPYNERGVPFCCDTHHAIPTAYQAEWAYLQANTDLWHLWQPDSSPRMVFLRSIVPDGQVLIECLGSRLCQRNFRSITCRSFPFFPYISHEHEFIGLSYYWEYEDRCWVISHLSTVTPEYLSDFIQTYDRIFEMVPEELANFQHYSASMRHRFGRMKRAIPLYHRNGNLYKVTPRSGRMRGVDPRKLPKFGPYRIAEQLPFPGDACTNNLEENCNPRP